MRPLPHKITWKCSGDSKALKILGVNPWIYDFAAFNVWSRPAGLLCCLDMLHRAGADTALVDFMAREMFPGSWPEPQRTGRGRYPKLPLPKPWALQNVPRQFSRYGASRQDVVDAMADLEPGPDLILITSLMTYWYPGVMAAIRLIKELFPFTPVCLGGIYATLCPDHAMGTGADFVFSGPLERSDNWNRLWSISGRKTPQLPVDAGMRADVSFYPAPDFSILMTTRGCPFNCPYCAASVIYPGFSRSTPETLIRHLNQEYQRGVRDFAFYDDALLVHAPGILHPVLSYVIDNKLEIGLHAPNALHIRYLTPRTCRMLRQAGLGTVKLGLETANFSRRQDTKLQLREFEQGIANLEQAGFVKDDIVVYILGGLPGQSDKDLEATIISCHALGLKPEINFYSPVPGTPFFDKACAYSRFSLSDPLVHNNSIWPCSKHGFSWEEHKKWKDMVRGKI